MRSRPAPERRPLRSLALRAALVAAAAAVLAEPAGAQFTAAVTQPRRRPAPRAEAVARGAIDTVRTTELSDLKAWVDSAATVLGSTPATPPAAPRDSAAARRDSAPPSRPPRAQPPRRPPTPPG